MAYANKQELEQAIFRCHHAQQTESDTPHLGGLGVGSEAAEDRVLCIVYYDLRALLAVVLLQLGKALDDRHQGQLAGAAGAEQRQDVEGGHGAQLIAEQHFLVLPEEDPSKNFMAGLMIQTLSRELFSVADENGGKLVPPLLGSFLCGRQIFRQQEDYRCEQSLSGIVKKCVLPVV